MVDPIIEALYPRLAADYIGGNGRARSFFTHAPEPAGLTASAAARAGSAVHPDLPGVLARQNAACGNTGAGLAAVERLREPGCLTVVTGQQIGLFGGALYVPFKVIRAVHLAAAMETELGRPVVPVYWLGTDDGDFDEINAVTLAGNDGALQTLSFEAPGRRPEQPVGMIPVPDELRQLIDTYCAALRPTDFTEDLKALLQDCYREGATLGSAAMHLAARLYGDLGVVLLDPSDAEFKALIRPVLDRECTDSGPSADAYRTAADAVTAAGYDVQVTTEEGRLNLFAEIDGVRVALFCREGAVTDRNGNPVAAADCTLSTHVLSRCLCQDAVLNTLAYVAGPSEIGYIALLKRLYELHGIPMPVIMPRYMGSLIEPRIARSLEAFGGQAADFILNLKDRAVHAVFSSREAADLDEVRSGLETQADVLTAAAGESLAFDAGNALEGDLQRLNKGIKKQLGDLIGNVRKRTKQKHETDLKRAEAVSEALRPGGALQERTFNLFQLMNLYGGLPFVRTLAELLQTSSQGHNLWQIRP